MVFLKVQCVVRFYFVNNNINHILPDKECILDLFWVETKMSCWVNKEFQTVSKASDVQLKNVTAHVLTFMRLIECRKDDHKEGSGVFASIGQVREGTLWVPVTSQALHKPEPGRQTLDYSSYSIWIRVTYSSTWFDRKQQTSTCHQ